MTIPVAFDIGIREFQGNRIFDPDVAGRFPGASPFVRLHAEAARAGFDLVTSDVYIEKMQGRRALLLADMHSRVADRLIASGLVPAASLCMESPLWAHSFYHSLGRHSRKYPHVFYFEGMRERVTSPATTFHVMYFPQSRKELLGGTTPWRKREFLSMVASRKRAFPRRKVRNLSDLRREWILRQDPWMASDLYPDRLRAIVHFAARPGFHLYGYGWRSGPRDEERILADSLDAAYRGETPDKVATLAEYRFALCFENTRFPGYVTEKIFDSFFAGTIPVYYGAPDISNFVPEDTFVDVSRFRSYGELEATLRGYGEDAAGKTLDAIRSFLLSEAFRKFTEDHFARSLVDVFREVASREGMP